MSLKIERNFKKITVWADGTWCDGDDFLYEVTCNNKSNDFITFKFFTCFGDYSDFEHWIIRCDGATVMLVNPDEENNCIIFPIHYGIHDV